MANIRDYTNYLVYLCRCSVVGEKPTNGFPEGMDFEQFFRFCYDHQLVGLAYDMISKIKTGYEDTQTMLIFKDKHNYAVLKDASQEYYFSIIKEAFSENNMDYAPLKGVVIKNMYPVPYYRQCTDIDILIRSEEADKARDIMEDLGFETKVFGYEGATDNYKIDKFTYIELHRGLIPLEYKEFQSCNDIPKRMILKGNNEYAMTDEDFYIFMIIHAAKHLKWSAVGIRVILDVWIYLRNKTRLDWDFINNELRKCGLNEFHKKLMLLVGYWFEEKEAEDVILAMADYIGESGWNGTTEQTRAHDLKEMGAIAQSQISIITKYFLKSAFMGRRLMQKRYPILKRHPYVLPACWVHRGFEVVFKRRNMIHSVIHTYDDVETDKTIQIDAMRKNFGL